MADTFLDLLEVPYGYCYCRCGGLAPIAKKTRHRLGQVKGQSIRFIQGHHARVQCRPFTERFWSQIEKNGPIIRTELGPCWLWTDALNFDGYGQVWVNARGRPVGAHRVAWTLENGPIPLEWLVVMHTCDNPPCCNPAHLELREPDKNVNDMVAKGRQARGERQGSAKLQQSNVEEIRLLYAAGGITQEMLAQRFGVNQTTVSKIIRVEHWKHVA